jgi:hypothetical protein
MNVKLIALALITVTASCATSAGRSSSERAIVYSGNAVPSCEIELVQEIAVTVSVKGDRTAAEDALHRELARRAERSGADGVMAISVQAPDRVPFTVTGGRPPMASDLPAVRWSARAHAIRFVDPACRS